MKREAVLAPVIDLAPRRQARERIVQAANRIRMARARYVYATVNRPVEPPALLSLRHIHLAVAVVRHWGAVDDAILVAAGFRVRPVVRRAVRGDLLDGEAA